MEGSQKLKNRSYDPTIALEHVPKGLYPTTEILAHPCLLLHYSQQGGNRTSIHVYQEKNK